MWWRPQATFPWCLILPLGSRSTLWEKSWIWIRIRMADTHPRQGDKNIPSNEIKLLTKKCGQTKILHNLNIFCLFNFINWIFLFSQLAFLHYCLYMQICTDLHYKRLLKSGSKCSSMANAEPRMIIMYVDPHQWNGA